MVTCSVAVEPSSTLNINKRVDGDSMASLFDRENVAKLVPKSNQSPWIRLVVHIREMRRWPGFRRLAALCATTNLPSVQLLPDRESGSYRSRSWGCFMSKPAPQSSRLGRFCRKKRHGQPCHSDGVRPAAWL